MTFKRSHIAAAHDIIMAALSFILSLYVRLGDDRFSLSHPSLLEGVVLFTLVCVCVFSGLQLYRGMWRYASLQDLVAITKAVTLSLLIFMPMMFLLNRLEGIPRSLLFINWLVLMAMLGGPRFLYRLVKDYYFMPLKPTDSQRIPVLLAGINHNTELFLRETFCKGASEYTVVGLLDNAKEKIGSSMYNVPIYGDYAALPEVVQLLRQRGTPPQKILLAADHIELETARNMLETADALGLSLARLPRLSELKHGVDEKIQVQPLAIEDLLGRPQHVLDRQAMQALVEGKKVLVTGAGGTIGSELVRQIAGYNPQHITLAEFSECNLYHIDKELAVQYPGVARHARIVDIRDRALLSRVFSETAPDIVFHAAALKHVPLMEGNVTEAVLTNVLGTKNVADCCMAHQVKHMVAISTDKVVNPTNIMGTTKRIAELYIQALGQAAHQQCLFTIVRFGNVLGSSGSVIPLFQEQLQQGGPLTVTHPEIERYFMTIREAVELVLEASAYAGKQAEAKNGSIFVLDMGKPIKIRHLAEQIIRLAGLQGKHGIGIVYTGLRPGEKLTEELFYSFEALVNTPYDNILLASSPAVDLETLASALAELVTASRKGDTANVLALLARLVPGYQQSSLAA